MMAACLPAARAVSGRATAAPPSATNNSRRPMMTVIRPSRARCAKGTIPRHERAVLPFNEGRMLVASTFGFNQLLPLALGERRHRGLALRLVAVSQHVSLRNPILVGWRPLHLRDNSQTEDRTF